MCWHRIEPYSTQVHHTHRPAACSGTERFRITTPAPSVVAATTSLILAQLDGSINPHRTAHNDIHQQRVVSQSIISVHYVCVCAAYVSLFLYVFSSNYLFIWLFVHLSLTLSMGCSEHGRASSSSRNKTSSSPCRPADWTIQIPRQTRSQAICHNPSPP